MSRGPDAGTLLERALRAAAAAAGSPIVIRAADWRRWASATFTGARHRITVEASPCPAFETWLADLPEAEFRLRGHIVADLSVVGIRRSGTATEVVLEVLTVEAR